MLDGCGGAGDIVVGDADEIELKGLDGRHRLYRVVWAEPVAPSDHNGRQRPYLVHGRRAG